MRILIGSLLAAALAFSWGYVYWTMLPFSMRVIRPLPDEVPIVQALQANNTKGGIYRIPGPPADVHDAEAMNSYEEQFEKGPLAMLYYRPEGDQFMSPQYFGYGFGQIFLAALAAAVALSASDIRVYPGRVMLVVWMGIFCALWAPLSDVAFYHFPMEHFWLKAGYTVSSAIIMGIVLALFVKPPAQEA